MPEANRLQGGNSFRDTAKVLKMTRYAVAWMATGCAMGAYEAALKYSQERLQFGKPIGSFQLVQDLLGSLCRRAVGALKRSVAKGDRQ